jgi:acetylornithine deacetylase/succinyl-diaminopimelate desuccinylase-like protein
VSLSRALAYARSNRRRALAELQRFVTFPSISGDARHVRDVDACGHWLASRLRAVGLEQVRRDGDIVCGSWRHAPGRPTALIYGHYDVVGVEPLAAWRSPPFQPSLRGGRLYGRGASDDKGQLLAHLKAIEAYLASARRLPVNVVCVFEGSEEIGSPGLESFLGRHRRSLRCDAAVVSDTRMLGPGRPALTYALRGTLSLELSVRTGRRAVHSGQLGGAVLSAAHALADLVAGLHRPNGLVAVPGFYRAVEEVDPRRRARDRRCAPRDGEILRAAGTDHPWGDLRFTVHERTTIRPALIVTELCSGQGGYATVPVTASARLNVRLVPGQDPNHVERAIRDHVTRQAPHQAQVAVRRASAARPVLIDTSHPAMAAASRALRHGFGAAPTLVRSGGTIPAVDLLSRSLGVPVPLMGFALSEDNAHGPNESFALSSLSGGIATSIHFLAELARTAPKRARRGPAPVAARA